MIKEQIENCTLHPSGIPKADVEEVFLAVFGCRSQAWMGALLCQELVPEQNAPESQAYGILLFLTDGMVAQSEIGLYPYVFTFYSAGAVLYCLSYLSSTFLLSVSCQLLSRTFACSTASPTSGSWIKDLLGNIS